MPLKKTPKKAISIALPPPGTVNLLPVRFARQEQSNWCWAACCQMVFAYYGTNVRQCEMASFNFGAACCQSPSSSACNQGSWPEKIYQHWGSRCSRSSGAFSLATLQTEINNGRPIEPYYAWSSNGAHVAVVIGYYDNGDLSVSDPYYGPGRRSYNNVLTAYGMGRWSMTFHDLRR